MAGDAVELRRVGKLSGAFMPSQERNLMCGIVGYIGPEQAVDFLIEGLRRLEYRGYDSSGVVTIDDGEFSHHQDGRPHRRPGGQAARRSRRAAASASATRAGRRTARRPT